MKRPSYTSSLFWVYSLPISNLLGCSPRAGMDMVSSLLRHGHNLREPLRRSSKRCRHRRRRACPRPPAAPLHYDPSIFRFLDCSFGGRQIAKLTVCILQGGIVLTTWQYLRLSVGKSYVEAEYHAPPAQLGATGEYRVQVTAVSGHHGDSHIISKSSLEAHRIHLTRASGVHASSECNIPIFPHEARISSQPNFWRGAYYIFLKKRPSTILAIFSVPNDNNITPATVELLEKDPHTFFRRLQR